MHFNIEEYLSFGDYSPQSEKSYRHYFSLLESLGPIESITPERLKLWFNEREWKSGTRRIIVVILKAYLRWAGYLSHPVLKMKTPKDRSEPGRSLSQQQVDKLLACFDTSTAKGWRDLAMVTVMLDTGLRVSEIVNISLDDLSLDSNQIKAQVKGGGWRYACITSQTALFVSAWLQYREKIAKCDSLFVGAGGLTPGRKMNRGGVKAIFRVIGKRAGLSAFSPHDLRRTMATLYTEAGAPTRWVMAAGGWRDFKTVERYTRRLVVQDVERWSPVTKAMKL